MDRLWTPLSTNRLWTPLPVFGFALTLAGLTWYSYVRHKRSEEKKMLQVEEQVSIDDGDQVWLTGKQGQNNNVEVFVFLIES